MMSQPLCPRCGTAIPESTPGDRGIQSDLAAPEIQCPRCLLRPPWDKPHPVAITLGPGQSFIPPSIEELAGHITGYEVEAIIGQGGMGAVYRGRQKSLDRRVAIKILPPQIAARPGFRERFGQEGRALAKLNHPNIVAVHDFGQAGPYAMLVMELVEGANLREVLAQGKLSPTEALEIIPQLCEALSYAHDEGVVHRDIKPENLLFDARGRLKITDFGLAKLVLNKSTEDNERVTDPTQGVVGTIHYMAPEQLENPASVDHRADIYALGVVFYEMLTGELPIGRFEPPSHFVGKPTGERTAKFSIDVRLDEVVLRALEKHPEKRYGSASALMHDLDEIEKAPKVSMGERILPDEHRRRVRDAVHRVSDTAGNLATASVEAASDWASRAKTSWLVHPRTEIPAFIAVAIVVLGTLLAIGFANSRNGVETAFGCLLLTGTLGLVFARVSLARERTDDSMEPLLSTRIVLGVLYLAVLVPIALTPMIGTIAVWSEIYGFPRDVGEPGWLMDWTQSISVSTAVTAFCALMVLAIHVAFPKLLNTLFRPFSKKLSKTVAAALAALMVLLIVIAFVTKRNMTYESYLPGTVLEADQWSRLSPRDFTILQLEQRKQEREIAIERQKRLLEE